MHPKYIFSAFFIVASLLSMVLPRLSNASGLPAPAAQTAVAAVAVREPARVDVQQSAARAAQSVAQAAQAAGSNANESIPLTSVEQSAAQVGQIELANFIQSVANSQPGVLVGVFVPGLFALPVVQQPAGNHDYVSPTDGTLTQYGAAAQYGATAILAHNYLSGRNFFQLRAGQEAILVYGDGSTQRFRVNAIEQFHALDSTNPYSDFINIADSSRQVLPFSTIFDRFYTVSGQVVFQTCIENNGDPSWGRIFVVATPY